MPLETLPLRRLVELIDEIFDSRFTCEANRLRAETKRAEREARKRKRDRRKELRGLGIACALAEETETAVGLPATHKTAGGFLEEARARYNRRARRHHLELTCSR